MPGVYSFATAGHGGVVAVVQFLTDVAPSVVESAREAGFVRGFALLQTRGRRTAALVMSGRRYALDNGDVVDLTSVLARWPTDRVLASGEVWIGEEDCDWSSLFAASDEVRRARNQQVRATHDSERAEKWVRDFGGPQYARDVLEALLPGVRRAAAGGLDLTGSAGRPLHLAAVGGGGAQGVTRFDGWATRRGRGGHDR